MDQVTDELLVEGIEQFADAMRRLLAGIEERRAAVVTGRPPTIRATLPAELAGASRQARQACARRKRRRARLAPGRVAVGRARAFPRSRTGSAG